MIAELLGELFELVIWGAFWDGLNREYPNDLEGCRIFFESEWMANEKLRSGEWVSPGPGTPTCYGMTPLIRIHRTIEV